MHDTARILPSTPERIRERINPVLLDFTPPSAEEPSRYHEFRTWVESFDQQSLTASPSVLADLQGFLDGPAMRADYDPNRPESAYSGGLKALATMLSGEIASSRDPLGAIQRGLDFCALLRSNVGCLLHFLLVGSRDCGIREAIGKRMSGLDAAGLAEIQPMVSRSSNVESTYRQAVKADMHFAVLPGLESPENILDDAVFSAIHQPGQILNTVKGLQAGSIDVEETAAIVSIVFTQLLDIDRERAYWLHVEASRHLRWFPKMPGFDTPLSRKYIAWRLNRIPNSLGKSAWKTAQLGFWLFALKSRLQANPVIQSTMVEIYRYRLRHGKLPNHLADLGPPPSSIELMYLKSAGWIGIEIPSVQTDPWGRPRRASRFGFMIERP